MTLSWQSCDPATAAFVLFLGGIVWTHDIQTEFGPQPVYAMQDWQRAGTVPWWQERVTLDVPDPGPGNVTLIRIEAADAAGNVSWGDGGCR